MLASSLSFSAELSVSPLGAPLQGVYTPPPEPQTLRCALASALLCESPLQLRGSFDLSAFNPLLDGLSKLGLRHEPDADGLRLHREQASSLPGTGTELSHDCMADAEAALLLSALSAGLCLSAELRVDAAAAESIKLRESLDVLRQLGASITDDPDQDKLLLQIRPAKLHDAKLLIAAQPQLNTALLLAAQAAGVELSLREPKYAQDHAYRLLRAVGAEIFHSSEGSTLTAASRLSGAELKLPGCPHAALARLCTAVMLEGSDLRVPQCSLNPRRAAGIKLLHECAPAQRDGGGGLARPRTWQFGYEPVAELRALFSQRIRGFNVLPNRAALLLEELPWLLALASRVSGTVLLRGFERGLSENAVCASGLAAGSAPNRAQHTGLAGTGAGLRYIGEMLRSFGIDAEFEGDGWRISGPAQLHGAELHCAGDYLLSRIALVLARFAVGETRLYSTALSADETDWTTDTLPFEG